MQLADLRALQSLASLLPHIQSIEARRGGSPIGKFHTYFPDEGPLRRELYPKALQFFAGGLEYAERILMAANRVGKTETGAYEMTAHMTGLYPPWWTGRRFRGPVDVWMSGDTSLTTRDILQLAMLGRFGELGTGMVPAHLIVGEPTRKHGIPEAYETFWVRHVSGGVSRAGFKSYDQKRKSFQGTAKHVVWLDEEPDDDGGVYSEALTRTAVVEDAGERTSGIIYLTATPLRGLSIFIKESLEKGVLLDPAGRPCAADDIWKTPPGADIQ